MSYLLACICSAQAYQDVFSDFDAWLRDTERKIQRDDPLKLEINELKQGLTYLQVYNIHVHCICIKSVMVSAVNSQGSITFQIGNGKGLELKL